MTFEISELSISDATLSQKDILVYERRTRHCNRKPRLASSTTLTSSCASCSISPKRRSNRLQSLQSALHTSYFHALTFMKVHESVVRMHFHALSFISAVCSPAQIDLASFRPRSGVPCLLADRVALLRQTMKKVLWICSLS